MNRSTTKALLLAAATLITAPAEAFTAKTTADGLPIRWERPDLTMVADASLATIDSDAIEAVRRAFAAWENVPGTSAPRVSVTPGMMDEVGGQLGSRQCTIRYAPNGYAKAGRALAITVLTFDVQGRILDADIVINGGSDRRFAILAEGDDGDDDEVYDLQNVLTHEVGHVFGLDESVDDREASMYFETSRGETRKRTLTDDDEEGLRAIYPHQDEVVMGSCATKTGEVPSGGGWAAAGALVLAAAIARRGRAR